MNPLDFQLLLVKYRKGNCTQEERELVEAWYDNLDKGQNLSLDEDDKNRLEEKIWLDINGRIRRRAVVRPQPLWPSAYRWLGIAASVLMVLGVSFYLSEWQTKKPGNIISKANTTETKNVTTYTNQGTTTRKITLADGSLVSLHPSSELKLGKEFNRTVREVTLTGEAFFRVARNVEKPFLVRTRDITTKVLGTSFNVKAYPSQKSSIVSVKTGRVSVSNHGTDHAETVVLTPNQQIVFEASKGVFRKELVENPEPLAGNQMRFEERPVREVFAALEEAFGVPIRYNQKTMENCNVTIEFSSENLFERLDILCKILGASYEDKNAAILIQSTGCGQ